MNKIRFIVLIVVLLAVNFAHPTPSDGQATAAPTPVNIQGFHLVSPTEGWVWTNHLYWTKDSGQSWTDITPPNLNGGTIALVAFVDNRYGVVIITTTEQTTLYITYTVAQTTDGGKTWETKPLNIQITARETDGTRLYLQLFDIYTGWLRISQRFTSLSTSTLFKTTDSGITWTNLNLPAVDNPNLKNIYIDAPVYFVTDKLGWIVGGDFATKNTLYRTQDGGQTWQTQTIGVAMPNVTERFYQLPQFVNAQDGVLTIGNTINNKDFEEVYITHDGGITWQLDSTLDGNGLITLVDSTHWIGVIRHQQLVQRTTTQAATPTILSQDPLIATIVNMDFVSTSTALALSWYETCPPNPTPGQCVEHHQLLYTSDGGQTWQPLTLPEVKAGT